MHMLIKIRIKLNPAFVCIILMIVLKINGIYCLRAILLKSKPYAILPAALHTFEFFGAFRAQYFTLQLLLVTRCSEKKCA